MTSPCITPRPTSKVTPPNTPPKTSQEKENTPLEIFPIPVRSANNSPGKGRNPLQSLSTNGSVNSYPETSSETQSSISRNSSFSFFPGPNFDFSQKPTPPHTPPREKGTPSEPPSSVTESPISRTSSPFSVDYAFNNSQKPRNIDISEPPVAIETLPEHIQTAIQNLKTLIKQYATKKFSSLIIDESAYIQHFIGGIDSIEQDLIDAFSELNSVNATTSIRKRSCEIAGVDNGYIIHVYSPKGKKYREGGMYVEVKVHNFVIPCDASFQVTDKTAIFDRAITTHRAKEKYIDKTIFIEFKKKHKPLEESTKREVCRTAFEAPNLGYTWDKYREELQKKGSDIHDEEKSKIVLGFIRNLIKITNERWPQGLAVTDLKPANIFVDYSGENEHFVLIGDYTSETHEDGKSMHPHVTASQVPCDLETKLSSDFKDPKVSFGEQHFVTYAQAIVVVLEMLNIKKTWFRMTTDERQFAIAKLNEFLKTQEEEENSPLRAQFLRTPHEESMFEAICDIIVHSKTHLNADQCMALVIKYEIQKKEALKKAGRQ